MFEEYRVANMPSCITWHDGILWVATHNALFKSIMISYKYQDGELMEQQRYQIPEKVQGIAFDEQDRVYLSTSYGRSNSSYLKIYQNVDVMDTKPRTPELKEKCHHVPKKLIMQTAISMCCLNRQARNILKAQTEKGRAFVR